ncbi:hypothetical protein BOX15_Mlig000072g1 [Macrostomum lignano]|uniref:Uncharacterized protein n=1 Tax=Macrostomum lignano TaxID=282301 RepID=A0A267EK54_9PLAT|nr:hypothetical protein BOX15_Mlig000072g1 [Macrostomum lignano]
MLPTRLFSRVAVSGCRRLLSGSSQLVQLREQSASDGVVSIELCRKPANAMNGELAAQFNKALLQAEKSGARAVLLRSQLAGIFSAGFELTELAGSNRERLIEFYTEIQELFLNLFGTDLVVIAQIQVRFVVIAQIQGHCMAGAMALSLSSDYRLMSSNPKLLTGLNETQFGVAPPVWLVELFRFVAGNRNCERLVAAGQLIGPQAALEAGLVDELFDNEAELLKKTESTLSRYLAVSPRARADVKRMLRSNLINRLDSARQEDMNAFCDYVLDSRVQAQLGQYLDKLKAKKA